MESTKNLNPELPNEKAGSEALPSSIHCTMKALDEINRTLHQMLFLSELSASDKTVDRESLQKLLERLKAKIDRIADQLESL